jgi:hypothetical protein
LTYKNNRKDKIMDNYEAVGICEGFIECDDESKTIEAWQEYYKNLDKD